MQAWEVGEIHLSKILFFFFNFIFNLNVLLLLFRYIISSVDQEVHQQMNKGALRQYLRNLIRSAIKFSTVLIKLLGFIGQYKKKKK